MYFRKREREMMTNNKGNKNCIKAPLTKSTANIWRRFWIELQVRQKRVHQEQANAVADQRFAEQIPSVDQEDVSQYRQNNENARNDHGNPRIIILVVRWSPTEKHHISGLRFVLLL